LEANRRLDNNSGNKVNSMVHLMKSWKSAYDAMRCSIKAASACPEFEIFGSEGEAVAYQIPSYCGGIP
jgi:hypothetical protein